MPDWSVLLLALVLIAVAVLAVVLASRLGRSEVGQQSLSDLGSNIEEPRLSARPIPAPARELTDMLPHEFVVLDLETTGLDSSRDEIIEFGAIRVTLNSQTHKAFQTLVKPVKRIPTKITKITGISQEMVEQDGLPLQVALRDFVEFIGDLPLVTFNAEFDMGFLLSAARQHGLTIANRYTCALKRARRAWPGLPSYRLVDLAKRGHLECDDAHRALGDCTRALIVFTAATSQLGQKVRWTKPSEKPLRRNALTGAAL